LAHELGAPLEARPNRLSRTHGCLALPRETRSESSKRFAGSFRRLRASYSNATGQRTAIEIVDEYDVQYLIHALLVLHFDYVVAEEHTPIRGGNPARMDFLLKNERIVVETKMTRKNLG
jgi:hypothetical protein